VYIGQTAQACCLCDDPDTTARIDIPLRSILLIKDSGSVAWRDIVGAVSVHFCAGDWKLVGELVTEINTNPIGQYNVARASFSIREYFEALLAETRDEPNQTVVESRLITYAILLADSEVINSFRVCI
jgi:hypothetical protein